MRHRRLLELTTFDRDDIGLLIEAAECGDIEVLHHAVKLLTQIPCLVFDKAVINGHIECVEFLTKHTSLKISGRATEELIRKGDYELLKLLMNKNRVSDAGLYIMSIMINDER